MKNLLILITLFISAYATCQDTYDYRDIDESKNFIYLNSGEVVYPLMPIHYKTPFFKRDYLEANGKKYKLQDVKFYNKNGEFYGNVMSIGNSKAGFAERVLKGKINLYERIVSTYVPSVGMGMGMGMAMGTTSTSKSNYYNKGYDDLKIANYDNLIVDLADNPNSMDHLNLFNKKNKNKTLFYVLGGSLFLVGGVTAFKNTGETTMGFNQNTGLYGEQNVYEIRPLGAVAAVAGFVTIIVNYLINRDNFDHIEDAIYEYNNN